MRQLLIFTVFAIGIWACGGSSTSQQAAKTGPGEKIFKQYCVACHGLNGDLQLNGAKDLAESTLTQTERVLLITNGKGMMTPFKGLIEPGEIEAVAAYTIRRFKPK